MVQHNHDARPSHQQVILIVDDDLMVDSALKTLFERRGFEVIVAANADQARKQLHQQPDWMIVDLLLPDGDGLSLLQHVREKKMDTRVILITGYPNHPIFQKVQQYQPDAILPKPFELNALLATVGLGPMKSPTCTG